MIVHGVELNVDKPGVPLIVARDWGQQEEIDRRPLVGPAGQLFDEVLAYGGWRRQDCNITNVVPECRPPYDDFKKHDLRTVEAGRAALDKLVKRLKPSLIITMGNEAAYHFVPDWPTAGRDIFGAKGIEDRRGYFWETRSGWVYTILHPAGAARKIVPGYELLCRDFKRAKQWVQGKLPRQEFPEYRTLTRANLQQVLTSRNLAFDIETQPWCGIFTCGFTGDDGQPYVAKYGDGLRLLHQVLAERPGVRGIAHNGQYDADLLDRAGYPTALYTDDTQTAWGNGLEPELAFHDDEDQGRLTRKGLASLASICPTLNVPYWKTHWSRPGYPEWIGGYPPEGTRDLEELAKLYTMAARDTFATKKLWNWLWAEVQRKGREAQYRLAFRTNLCCITMTRRGWRVDDALRRERIKTLTARAEQAKGQASAAALAYIHKYQIEDFKIAKQCACCNGTGSRCWSCAGLPAMPKRKADYLLVTKSTNGRITRETLDTHTVKELRELLPPCAVCGATGKQEWYDFNPYSVSQLSTLLYQHIHAPQWVFKGKVKMDEMATIRLLQWAGGEAR